MTTSSNPRERWETQATLKIYYSKTPSRPSHHPSSKGLGTEEGKTGPSKYEINGTNPPVSWTTSYNVTTVITLARRASGNTAIVIDSYTQAVLRALAFLCLQLQERWAEVGIRSVSALMVHVAATVVRAKSSTKSRPRYNTMMGVERTR